MSIKGLANVVGGVGRWNLVHGHLELSEQENLVWISPELQKQEAES
jgi:hypothetical protein